MLFDIEGWGTTFYGECDYAPDGTYTSTYWIILAFIPVIPLYSARIMYSQSALFSTTTEYKYQKLPINWWQVGRIWGFVLALIGGYIVGAMGFETGVFSEELKPILLTGYLLTMLLLPILLRYRAKKKAHFQANTTRLPMISKKILWLLGIFIACVGLLFICSAII